MTFVDGIRFAVDWTPFAVGVLVALVVGAGVLYIAREVLSWLWLDMLPLLARRLSDSGDAEPTRQVRKLGGQGVPDGDVGGPGNVRVVREAGRGKR